MKLDRQAFGRFVDGGLKGGQVLFDDIPDQGEVDAEILVSQDVSGASYLRPGDGRLLITQTVCSQVFDGLSDHFQISYDGVLRFVIPEKGFSAILHIGFYAQDAIVDVLYVNSRVLFHNAIASARMRLRR